MLPNRRRNLIRRMWETSGFHPVGNAKQIVGMVPSGCARFARMPKRRRRRPMARPMERRERDRRTAGPNRWKILQAWFKIRP
jgi:hypothetical protein